MPPLHEPLTMFGRTRMREKYRMTKKTKSCCHKAPLGPVLANTKDRWLRNALVENEGSRIMKIVVIGGTGLIGSKLVNKLREYGHEAVAASPNSGVNTLTGGGPSEVLKGASLVVDVPNSPSWEGAAALNFFLPSTRNLLPY